MSKIRLDDGESVNFYRAFVIGLYKGSMRRLLLRSEKGSVHSTRIDMLFMNVQHLSLATHMEGLEVQDLSNLESGRELLEENNIAVYSGTDTRVYGLSWATGGGHIIAGSATYIEDGGEYWEESSFDLDP